MRSLCLTPVVTLLTDFGTSDHYAAVMRGVIATICSQAHVVDITHQVEPFQVAQAAYLLMQSWTWFPPGTIHVIVVDPGVGSHRRPLVAEAAGHLFVLPDNGLLSPLEAEITAVREIQNEALMLKPVSRTFHGRDIFSAAAAHFASGVPFTEAGPPVTNWVRLPDVARHIVLHIDRFGNVITNLRAADCLFDSRSWSLSIGQVQIDRRAATYAEAQPGEPFLLEGSGGYLEIALREASAAALIGCRVGDAVTLRLDDRS